MILERAEEIHIIDSCFLFLTPFLHLNATTKIVHRYASSHRTGILPTDGGVSCPKIEHSFFPSLFADWEILVRPRGASHLDLQFIYPLDGDVIIVGSEIGDLAAEQVVCLSTRKVRFLPSLVKVYLRHHINLSAPASAVVLAVTLPHASQSYARCPSLNGEPMGDNGSSCSSFVRLQDYANPKFGPTSSEMTLSVQGQLKMRRVTRYTLAAAGTDPMRDAEKLGAETRKLEVNAADRGAHIDGFSDGTESGSCAACEEVNVFSTLEHLPSRACLEGGGRPPTDEGVQDCVDRMEERLLARQLDVSGAECTEVKPAGFPNYGMGSTLHYLIVQLHEAALNGHRLAFLGEWVYGGCANQDFSCAFDPWSPCSIPLDRTHDPQYPRFSPRTLNIDPEFDACTGPQHNRIFHYASVFAHFLWRPNQAMREAAERARRSMDLPERYLGVHVRHGDFCIASKVVAEENKECFSVLAYAEALAMMAEQYEVSAVFVASDNEKSLRMLQALCPTLSLFWQRDVDRKFLEASIEDFDTEELWVESKLFNSAAKRRLDHLTEIMVDVILLLGAVGFVGQFSSNISRLVVEVNSRRHRRVMPYISLDLPFCYTGGKGFQIILDDGRYFAPEGKAGNKSYFYC